VTFAIRHGRWRRAVSLLAAGAIADAAERARVQAHADRCRACAGRLGEERAVAAALAADPLRAAEPPVSLAALRTRVFARLDERAPEAHGPSRAGLGFALGTAAAIAVAALGVLLLRGTTPRSAPPSARTAVAEDAGAGEAFVRRLERNVAREQAARYLDEAGDVLVTVAAQAHPCPKGNQRVDVAEEAQRSRELLARRSLLDVDAAAVATARPVLDDVEQVLREVASLESCARKRDLERVHRQIERSRLLLKIDLTARELQG
jgi:hypothetical protein